MTTRDRCSRDIRSATPDSLLVALGISQITLRSPSYCIKTGRARILGMEILVPQKKRNVTQWYTTDKNRCDIWVFRFVNLFKIVDRILISGGLLVERTMLKPVFESKFSKSHLDWGNFLLFWGI